MNWRNAIHPSVIIGNNVKMGKGILVMTSVIINAEAARQVICLPIYPELKIELIIAIVEIIQTNN